MSKLGTATITVGRAELSLSQFELRVTAGPDSGVAARSSGARLLVGSHRSAELQLSDRTVSRFHCEVVLDDGGVAIRDLGSRNGTRVDGVSIIAARLGMRATIAIGDTTIEFQVGSDRVIMPLAANHHFGAMVGASTAMRRTFAVLERAAESDATVLLIGETGTGKELAAESLHDESRRREGPFVVVDCGAVPGALLESELFGHERGAFTGATDSREGAFEAASGGTIFLDEIGEMPPELQPKLLRVLERREIKRVGSNQVVPVDVRVVAATNRDLMSEVNARRFRSDLYYRLAVLEIRLPALRERADDMPLLIERFLATNVDGTPSLRAELTRPEFVRELARHQWPGNVRELRNYLDRSLAFRTTELPAPAPSEGGASVDAEASLRDARDAWVSHFERDYLAQVVEKHDGNITAAARHAGVDRVHFYRLLWKYGLRKRGAKGGGGGRKG